MCVLYQTFTALQLALSERKRTFWDREEPTVFFGRIFSAIICSMKQFVNTIQIFKTNR